MRVREEGPGQCGPPRLLQYDGELPEPAAPAPVPLREVHSEQPLVGDRIPVAGPSGTSARSVKKLPYLLDRHVARQPAAYGVGQLPLFLRDSDAHAHAD